MSSHLREKLCEAIEAERFEPKTRWQENIGGLKQACRVTGRGWLLNLRPIRAPWRSETAIHPEPLSLVVTGVDSLARARLLYSPQSSRLHDSALDRLVSDRATDRKLGVGGKAEGGRPADQVKREKFWFANFSGMQFFQFVISAMQPVAV
jgi:hypothetical protein